VILVAVAITVSVAVAYWMSGIAGQYTQFEKVEIQTAICTLNPSTGNWQIEVKLKNSGSKASTLTNVFVNEAEVDGGVDGTGAPISGYDHIGPTAGLITTSLKIITPVPIGSGATGTIFVWIGSGYKTLSSGTTVNIKIHSAGGMDYIKLVQLI
jgi:hypothetical protein